jgi:hypothetical protein
MVRHCICLYGSQRASLNVSAGLGSSLLVWRQLLKDCKGRLHLVVNTIGLLCSHRRARRNCSATSQVHNLSDTFLLFFASVLIRLLRRMAHPLRLACFSRLWRFLDGRSHSRPPHALPARHIRSPELARNALLLGHHRVLRLHQHRRRMATAEVRGSVTGLAHLGFLCHFNSFAGLGAAG